MSQPTTLYQVDPDGVAVITLSYPPVNALHPQVLKSLFANAAAAHNDPKVKAIVVTGANSNFCAGFDINQFVNQSGGGIDNSINDSIIRYLESGPKPTVAAIDGVALGGGLEVAMGCNARITTPTARLGLPELQLGIIPGFGGTQRLPRLVGLTKGVEMMLTSKHVNAKEAKKIGLVDEIVPKDKLVSAAKAYALDILNRQRPWSVSLVKTDKLEPLADALNILEFASAQAIKKARAVQHPLMCLEAIRVGVEHGGYEGIKKEGEMFTAASQLLTHKALVHIFFAERNTKKVAGITDAGLTPRRAKVAAVLGGGLMGSGIATSLALADIHVLIKEVNQKFLDAGLDRVRSNIMSRVKKGAMTKEAAEAVLARVKGVTDYNDFGNVDIVVEAVIEDIPLKQAIFQDLERVCKPDAILSSNTSTIDLNIIGAKTRAQPRIIGAHFFSPAHIMPLLEIVRTDTTSKQVIVDVLDLATRIKKTPIVVGNCTGFAVNRVFFPYTQAAIMLLDLAKVDSPYTVDAALTGFGMPMGPFRLADLVGIDVSLHVGANFNSSFPERTYAAPVMQIMNENKRLGQKTGKGFYKYDGKRALPDPEIAPILAAARKKAGLNAPEKPGRMSAAEIIEYLYYPVVNEACRVLSEGIVAKPSDLDVATVMSMGFPSYRGGLVFWADSVGAATICRRLKEMAASVPPALTGFFEPSAYLRAAAESGRKLGDGVPQTQMSRM